MVDKVDEDGHLSAGLMWIEVTFAAAGHFRQAHPQSRTSWAFYHWPLISCGWIHWFSEDKWWSSSSTQSCLSSSNAGVSLCYLTELEVVSGSCSCFSSRLLLAWHEEGQTTRCCFLRVMCQLTADVHLQDAGGGRQAQPSCSGDWNQSRRGRKQANLLDRSSRWKM